MFKKENNKQEFLYESEHGTDEVKPMLKSVPDWYRRIPKSVLIPEESNEPILTAKACLPFLDVLTFGYSINLWTDILVERDDDNKPILRYKTGKIGARSAGQTNPMPTPTGFEEYHFTWQQGANILLPKGYSALYCHPLNRFELPFFTVAGIVDGDIGIGSGNIPWYLKKDFVGLIPKGTPIIQIIPFLRETWISKEAKGLLHEIQERNNRETHDWYRKLGWNRKSFK